MSSRVKPSFIVRKYELNDCEFVQKIWTENGFILPKYENNILMKIDSNAILVAQDIDSGELLGACSGTNHSNQFGFIGQFVVKPKYHGLGIGSEIWKKVMQHLGNEINISLYANPVMVQKYRQKWGFDIIADKKMFLYEGKPICNDLVKTLDDISVFPINEHNLKAVVEYDKHVCNGLERSILIEGFSQSPETVSLTAIDMKTDTVLGFCIICVTNFETAIVGPLYADNELIAELLIGKCIELLPNCSENGLIYQCWDTNSKTISLALKLGLRLKDRWLPIMFTKKIIDGKLDKIFCTSSRDFYPF